MSARCVKVWGKLPSCSPVGSTSAEYSPTWFAQVSIFSNASRVASSHYDTDVTNHPAPYPSQGADAFVALLMGSMRLRFSSETGRPEPSGGRYRWHRV